MHITPEQLVSSLRWRYATKKFDASQLIPAEVWTALEQSLVLTPSSFGLQPWKFLVIKNPDVRASLLAQSWGQAQVTDASHFVVLATRKDMEAKDIEDWIACMGEIQGTPAESLAGFKGVVEGFVERMDLEARAAWSAKQAYIALGQLMTSAAVLGIDACPMEGISPAGYDEILNLKDSGYATVVACALGYRSAEDKYATMPKARFDASRVIQHI
jgi:nitroreductase